MWFYLHNGYRKYSVESLIVLAKDQHFRFVNQILYFVNVQFLIEFGVFLQNALQLVVNVPKVDHHDLRQFVHDFTEYLLIEI